MIVSSCAQASSGLLQEVQIARLRDSVIGLFSEILDDAAHHRNTSGHLLPEDLFLFQHVCFCKAFACLRSSVQQLQKRKQKRATKQRTATAACKL